MFTLLVPARYFDRVMYSVVSWKIILVEKIAKRIRISKKGIR